jgi:hypothetical protein
MARPDGCYLLTRTGCCLEVRLFLCVDFLCPAILGRLSHEELVRLQTVSGHELITGFLLYDPIKRIIRGNGSERSMLSRGRRCPMQDREQR